MSPKKQNKSKQKSKKTNESANNKNKKKKPKTAKYAIGTRFWKSFGEHGNFEATVASFDAQTGFYRLTYDDGDQEEMTEREITQWIQKDLQNTTQENNTEAEAEAEPVENPMEIEMDDLEQDKDKKNKTDKTKNDKGNKPKKRKTTPTPPPALHVDTTPTTTTTTTTTTTNTTKTPKYQNGTKILKAFPGYEELFQGTIVRHEPDDSGFFYHIVYEDGDEEDLTERQVTRLINKQHEQQLQTETTPAATTTTVITTSSTKGRSIRRISYVDNNDSNDDDDDEEEEEAAPPKKRRRSSTASRAKKKKDDDEDDASVVSNKDLFEDLFAEQDAKKQPAANNKKQEPKPKKMHESYKPMNHPVYDKLTTAEIQATKQYLDPCGMDATDDIIGRLIGDQIDKVAGLWSRALAHDKTTLGSAETPLRLGTACSGTDAPALAMTMVLEQMELRRRDNDNDNNTLPVMHYSHEFSCENDPMKQAYLARNFDSKLYPDIARLCDNPAPRDVFGQEQPLPKANMFVAGTSCKDFSTMRSKKRKDIEDRGCSGETFLAACEVILKEQPTICILENVVGAWWKKMSEYIVGRIQLSDAGKGKDGETKDATKGPKELKFSFDNKQGNKLVVEEVPKMWGVHCGSTVAGFLKGDTMGKIHPVEWPTKVKKTEKCTLTDLLGPNKIDKKKDWLVFDRPVTYQTHWVRVDTKNFGLPQTRQRTYMFVWQTNPQPKDGFFYPDNLGAYWEALVKHLESPVKHPLEAFLLPLDHDNMRAYREALRGPLGRESTRRKAMYPNFWTTASKNRPHNKAARTTSGIGDEARHITQWGDNGKKKLPPHYWLEYMNCNSPRCLDVVDVLHAQALRDAESHDANHASFFWNVSQNVTKERHRTAKPGIASCITPGGDFLLPHQGRNLLGVEKLLIQGIPYFRLALGNETEVNLADLAGNAMSSTVVCATMLAALMAPQLRKEMQASIAGDDTTNKAPSLEKIKEFLEKHARLDSTGEQSRKWAGEISMVKTELQSNEADRHTGDKSCMELFGELAALAPLAVKSSVWCTCESSGNRSRTNKFVKCKVCCVSCCRNCISEHAGYNLDTHDTVEIEIGNESGADFPVDERNLFEFEKKLRSMLPSSVYLSKEGIGKVAEVENDRYRIRGLDKFSFVLYSIKRECGKWLIVYYARDKCGVGEAVAEMRITVGKVRRGQAGESNLLGLRCELTSFIPARSEPLQYGNLAPCCQLVLLLPKDGSAPNVNDATWQVRLPEVSSSIQLSGTGDTDSYRVEVGITDEAPEALEQHTKSKKGRYELVVKTKEERRWLYPKVWKKWPSSIRIRCPHDGIDRRVSGTYLRAACRQTTNQSALWIKQVEGKPSIYLLMKPNVSRTGGDYAIITTSMDFTDTSCILAELDQYWQPGDAFDATNQRQAVRCQSWGALPGFECKIPKSTIQVEAPGTENNLVVVQGLKRTEATMLERIDCMNRTSSGDGALVELNVTSGQRAQQVVRRINAIIAPQILKFAAMGGLRYDLSPTADWEVLESNDDEPFGTCVPVRPKESWFYDEERERWDRRFDHDASRTYYMNLQGAQKPFEFWLDRERCSLEIKMFPKVVAHAAAAQLLRGRGILSDDNKHGGAQVSFRLSDVSQQIDPTIDRFRVENCSALDATPVELQHPYKLYDRQRKVLTKMLAIEEGKTSFLEMEMSESNMPGTVGFSLMAQAKRSRNICGGVIADAIGAGKTVISIAIIVQGIERARASRATPRKSGATLVVVPPALIDQWESEVQKFAPSLVVITVHDFKELDSIKLSSLIEADVVVCPVDILESKKYLANLVQKAGLDKTTSAEHLPKLPAYSGEREQIEARGVWIPHESADPYNVGSKTNDQQRRNKSAYYTYVYQSAIQSLREKNFSPSDTGIPLEYFEFERLFVDEIHESLCTTKEELATAAETAKSSNVGFWKEKNRRAGRELLGITQKDVTKRPLVCRRAVFGLTGTPLLDSNSRVIELANLMGGTYVLGLSKIWRKLERESCRDIFLHNFLEPKPSRAVRRQGYARCQDYLKVACCRNRSGEEMKGIELQEHVEVIQMSEAEKTAYLKSQIGIPADQRCLGIKPTDFDENEGQDMSGLLRQNASCPSRGAKLVEICQKILSEAPTTKIIVFTDGSIGAGIAAREALCGPDGPDCTWLDTEDSVKLKNEKIGWYQRGDATDEDRQRPRVLVLHYEHAAGLNLQSESHNVILFSPLYVGKGGCSDDPVSDVSTELQAIGRVYRIGQPSRVVHVYRIEVQGPKGEECLDGKLIDRNSDPEVIAMATNAE
ncbi:C-5 cytosine-specific DNA methylase [Seminavis robusta]|uniref:C-5 cytosine-specific DNA methylase n=1 Tax=Seminavis robusta TaxID=568900 RepID=A0A9N8DTU8_9STRA|nr:C-5 cytosine-specific DNA methylase [Seminavis robusta]|eukprot:Sro338_g120910.1 C-5 cytosine-specific DNA methylase (2292) ;mRNA; f:55590-62811